MTKTNRFTATGGVVLIVAMVGSYVSTTTAEPQQTVATAPAVTPTDAEPAAKQSLSPATAAAQDAPPMGAAVAVEAKATIVEDEPTPQPELADPDGVHWFASYEQAMAESKRTGKPLLVFSTKSSGCAPCEALKRGAFADKGVIAWLNSDVVCCELLDKPLPFGKQSGYPVLWLRLKSGNGWQWNQDRPIDPKPIGFRNALTWAMQREASK